MNVLWKCPVPSPNDFDLLKQFHEIIFAVMCPQYPVSDIKRKYGLDMGKNYNLAVDPKKRVPQCPRDKEKMLLEALKHFKMIDTSVEIMESENVNDEG